MMGSFVLFLYTVGLLLLVLLVLLLPVSVRILVMRFWVALISGLRFACLWLVDIQLIMRPFDWRQSSLIIELL